MVSREPRLSVMMRCSSVVFLFLAQCSTGARILAVFHTFSMSHFAVFEPLVLQLISRGHEVVLVSGYPLSAPSNKYEHIDIMEAKQKFNGSWSLGSFPEIPTAFQNVLAIIGKQIEENENVFRLGRVQDLINSERKFDLVIVEQFTSDVFYSFATKFNAPLITFSSCPPMPWAMDHYGAPAGLAFSPNLFSGFTHNMGLTQRTLNVLQSV
uniref:Uncharacterized protein n=1 Tax=Homalodisca liturata TaxID=320908 RepID=A0A1B6H8E4_9HEMI